MSSFYLFMGLATVLLLLAVALSGVFNPVGAEAPASQPQFKTYSNPRYGYSITYPANWQVIDQAGFGVFTAASSATTEVERGGPQLASKNVTNGGVSVFNFNKIDVVAYNLDTELNVHDFWLAKSVSTPEGSVSNLKVSGQDALKVSVQPSQVLESHQDSQIYNSIFVTVGKRGYIISGVASPTVFDYILNSFRAF